MFYFQAKVQAVSALGIEGRHRFSGIDNSFRSRTGMVDIKTIRQLQECIKKQEK